MLFGTSGGDGGWGMGEEVGGKEELRWLAKRLH
jgi:hypothetical protein